MLTPGIEVFIRLPREEGPRRLSPADVCDVRSGRASILAHDGALRLEAGEEVRLYYEIAHAFHEHRVCIVDAQGEGSGLLLEVLPTGDPEPAEARASRRAGTSHLRLTADIANECMCPLLDVSVEGFAVLGRGGRVIGEQRLATIRLADADVDGRVCLASSARADDMLMRYGFRCVGEGSLAGALERMTAELCGEPARR